MVAAIQLLVAVLFTLHQLLVCKCWPYCAAFICSCRVVWFSAWLMWAKKLATVTKIGALQTIADHFDHWRSNFAWQTS
jgi:hypothetical protein